MLMATTHNLLKLFRASLATAVANQARAVVGYPWITAVQSQLPGLGSTCKTVLVLPGRDAQWERLLDYID
jgi:hypothetical protein